MPPHPTLNRGACTENRWSLLIPHRAEIEPPVAYPRFSPSKYPGLVSVFWASQSSMKPALAVASKRTTMINTITILRFIACLLLFAFMCGGRHVEGPSLLEVIDAVLLRRDLAREKAYPPVYLVLHLGHGDHPRRDGNGIGAIPIDEKNGGDNGYAESVREAPLPGEVDPLDLPAVPVFEEPHDLLLLLAVLARGRVEVEEAVIPLGLHDPLFHFPLAGPDKGVLAGDDGRIVLRQGQLGVLLHHVFRDVREGQGLPPRDVLDVVVLLDVLRRGSPDGLLLEVREKRLEVVGVHVPELLHRIVLQAKGRGASAPALPSASPAPSAVRTRTSPSCSPCSRGPVPGQRLPSRTRPFRA